VSLRRIGGGGTDGDAAGRERRPSDARSCGGVSSTWSLISSARNHKLWPFAKRTWYGRILGSFRSSVMSTPVCPTNSRVDWFNGSPLALTTMTVSPTLARRRRDDTFGGVDSNAAAFNFPQCGPAFGAAFGCAPSARKFICTQLHPGGHRLFVCSSTKAARDLFSITCTRRVACSDTKSFVLSPDGSSSCQLRLVQIGPDSWCKFDMTHFSGSRHFACSVFVTYLRS
jgi:hypothetical protein